MSKKTIAILAPCYNGDFDKETLDCIEELSNTKKYNIIDMTTKEVYIHRGRRTLMENVLDYNKNKRIDYVLWLDSDVQFKTSDVDKLIELVENNEKIKCVSGIYFNRHANHHPMFCKGNELNGYDWNVPILNYDYFVVDGVGFGFFLLPIETLEKYSLNYNPTKWFDSSRWYPLNSEPKDQKFTIGEDLYFCENLKKIGINVYVASNVLLEHKGITIKDYLDWKKKNVWETHCAVKVREWFK